MWFLVGLGAVAVACGAACWLLWGWWQSGRRLRGMLAKWPGPPKLPLIGSAHLVGTTTVDFMEAMCHYCEKFRGSPFTVWIGPFQVYVTLTHPKDIEVVLGSNKLLDKGTAYDFLRPWLGTGLLTSTGTKWRKHRKILTPTFHFKILEEFIDVFHTNCITMTNNLKREANGPGFDIYKYVTLCTLDIICESAMGVRINAQDNSDSEYVKAIRDESDIVMKRSTRPWLASDFLFSLTSMKKVHEKSVKILHATTNSVIKTRKAEIIKERESRDRAETQEDASQTDGVKKRLAFLDLLIESTYNGSEFTDEDIREEVDTFMFEGHDTTSSGISFAMWLLSRHLEVQEKVFQELQEVFPDPDEPLTLRGLQELKYMERVIKEVLRLYPSVPFYTRTLKEDVALRDDKVIPRGADIFISAYMVHRDPEIFPDPLKFDPDRFLPDNVQGRNPYAYIPFSAGPRNCIGQKFAMLEIKSTLYHMLRRYQLLPASETPNLILAAELILISASGVTVKIVTRDMPDHTSGITCDLPDHTSGIKGDLAVHTRGITCDFADHTSGIAGDFVSCCSRQRS